MKGERGRRRERVAEREKQSEQDSKIKDEDFIESKSCKILKYDIIIK